MRASLFLWLLICVLCVSEALPTSVDHPFFSCSHDARSHPPTLLSALPQLNVSSAPETAARSFTAATRAGKRKLRFLVRQELDSACAFEGQVVSTADGSGGFVTCAANDVLTPAKRARVDAALQASLAFLSDALYSTPTLTLSVTANVCPGVNSEAFVAEDYDFVLFVTSSPQGQSGGLVLAWGEACASVSSGLTARPVVGHINFITSGIGLSTAQLEASLAAHEITHALGFTSLYTTLSSYVDASGVWQSRGGTEVVYRPGLQKDVLLVKTPRVLAAARKHFGCDTLDGVEIEDVGGGGTAGSHWKKRILFQEALVGVVTSVKLFYTSITLAFFEDAGFYAVDYSVAEDQLPWGYGRGCPFLYQDCKTAHDQYGATEFCFDKEKSSVERCTFDQLSVGHCEVVTYDGALPTANQYFSGDPNRGGAQESMDYCPFRAPYANGNCLDQTLQDDRRDAIQNIYSNTFGPSSRCFESRLITAALPVINKGARCLLATCTSPDDGAAEPRLLLRIQEQTVMCPLDGGAGEAAVDALYGVHGQVTCPSAQTQCRGYNYSGVAPQLAVVAGEALSNSPTHPLFVPYTHSPDDHCDARRARCTDESGDALTSLLPRCALFAERALSCFGRRCHGTFQQWLASRGAQTVSPHECRNALDRVAARCVDGWEGATALCQLFTDSALAPGAHLRVVTALLASWAAWLLLC